MEAHGVDRQSIEEATKEAQERPTEFSPTERAAAIRDMVKVLVPLVRQGKLETELKIAYPSYGERFPELFKKIVTKQDLAPLNTMLAMLDKMAAGSISQHEASIVVGQRLVDRYVKPQLKGTGRGK